MWKKVCPKASFANTYWVSSWGNETTQAFNWIVWKHTLVQFMRKRNDTISDKIFTQKSNLWTHQFSSGEREMIQEVYFWLHFLIINNATKTHHQWKKIIFELNLCRSSIFSYTYICAPPTKLESFDVQLDFVCFQNFQM